MSKSSGRLKIANFIALTVAGAVNTIGVTIFLSPVKLYDSGFSGTSRLVSQITPEWLSLSLILLVLNIPIFCSVSSGRAGFLRFIQSMLLPFIPLGHG